MHYFSSSILYGTSLGGYEMHVCSPRSPAENSTLIDYVYCVILFKARFLADEYAVVSIMLCFGVWISISMFMIIFLAETSGKLRGNVEEDWGKLGENLGEIVLGFPTLPPSCSTARYFSQ